VGLTQASPSRTGQRRVLPGDVLAEGARRDAEVLVVGAFELVPAEVWEAADGASPSAVGHRLVFRQLLPAFGLPMPVA